MPETIVEIAEETTEELIDAVGRLLPQLSSSAAPVTPDDVAELVGSPATLLFVAKTDGHIVGMLTLVLFRLPSGLRAWIEDVVVDGDARGQGVGAAMNQAAIDEARRRSCRTIDLTSRPSRDVANRLYQRLGFVARDTNVYRLALDG